LLLDDNAAYSAMANAVNPYGDGKGAQRSVAAIAELLEVGKRLPDFSTELVADEVPRFEEVVAPEEELEK
ncbi:UDP-N-acetylglucosamine 2-epimerase (non-hydrolyzing), partial [Corynebacterium striatum]